MTASERPRWRDVDGILLLDKPPGITSNDALQRARRRFAARKAGHTGNLDLPASGLLPLCFGEATKVCAFLLDAVKGYRAAVVLGARTTTGDAAGEVLATAPVPSLDEAEVRAACAGLMGPQTQVPPMYSALKRSGEALHRLARRGIEVPREARPIRIDRLELTGLGAGWLEFEVECSKGTYVRTLAEDLAARLGTLAHLSALRRTRVGPFTLDGAIALADLGPLPPQDPADRDALLLPADAALAGWPVLTLVPAAVQPFRQGQAVRVPGAPASGRLRVYAADGTFLGLGEVDAEGRVAPRRLFAGPGGGAAGSLVPA